MSPTELVTGLKTWKRERTALDTPRHQYPPVTLSSRDNRDRTLTSGSTNSHLHTETCVAGIRDDGVKRMLCGFGSWEVVSVYAAVRKCFIAGFTVPGTTDVWMLIPIL